MKRLVIFMLLLLVSVSCFANTVYESIYILNADEKYEKWIVEYDIDKRPYTNGKDLEQDVLKVMLMPNCIVRGSCWPLTEDEESYFNEYQLKLARLYGMCKIWRKNYESGYIEEYYCFSNKYNEIIAVTVARTFKK